MGCAHCEIFVDIARLKAKDGGVCGQMRDHPQNPSVQWVWLEVGYFNYGGRIVIVGLERRNRNGHQESDRANGSQQPAILYTRVVLL